MINQRAFIPFIVFLLIFGLFIAKELRGGEVEDSEIYSEIYVQYSGESSLERVNDNLETQSIIDSNENVISKIQIASVFKKEFENESQYDYKIAYQYFVENASTGEIIFVSPSSEYDGLFGNPYAEYTEEISIAGNPSNDASMYTYTSPVVLDGEVYLPLNIFSVKDEDYQEIVVKDEVVSSFVLDFERFEAELIELFDLNQLYSTFNVYVQVNLCNNENELLSSSVAKPLTMTLKVSDNTTMETSIVGMTIDSNNTNLVMYDESNDGYPELP